ncbi:MAG: hypothetical protein HY432_03755 [Candidatus Liptonbacteria bacterium]|nr:hypothetical protein [Candidatus Liptonbacteria bacterium]
MNAETKICQNCKHDFVVEPEDFDFYKKIGMPPPTFCPRCRWQRRLMFRNERSLYFINCGLCKKKTISIYSPDSPFQIYDYNCWISDNWDRLPYGREYDFSRPFFEQFKELSKEIPHYATLILQSPGCETCALSWNSKNCYLSLVNTSEDCFYVHGFKLRNSLDVYWGLKLDFSYECVDCSDGNRVSFSQCADNCSFSSFIYDGRNLQNCLGCVGLRNKQYYIFNKPYSKEDYIKKAKEYDFGSYKTLSKFKEEFERMKMLYPRRFAHIIQSQNVTGNNIHESKNCRFCFDTGYGVENGKYLAIAGLNLKDSYDCYDVGTNSQLIYEGVDVGLDSSKVFFGSMVWTGLDVQYSKDCQNCSNVFGCVGLRNKKYCILNKQYSEGEYKKLLPRVIEHMNLTPYIDKMGNVYKYGEFFPSEISTFAYNETINQESFPLSEAEAKSKGFNWKAPELRNYSITKKAEDLPDHIKNIDNSILKEVIGCLHEQKCNEQCTQAFNIQSGELEFYKRMNVALPRLCPNCRHYQRITLRNPYKLWHRKCQCEGSAANGPSAVSSGRSNRKLQIAYRNTTPHFHGDSPCPNEFETSYAPERPETVYCEQCYNAEVI